MKWAAMMKVDLFSKSGDPMGTVEIPDDIIDAANRVNTFLSGQVGRTGAVQILCGLMLAPPKMDQAAPKEDSFTGYAWGNGKVIAGTGWAIKVLPHAHNRVIDDITLTHCDFSGEKAKEEAFAKFELIKKNYKGRTLQEWDGERISFLTNEDRKPAPENKFWWNKS